MLQGQRGEAHQGVMQPYGITPTAMMPRDWQRIDGLGLLGFAAFNERQHEVRLCCGAK
jgi:hypothetical protein